jgi:tetratricopeptide (TPR) repeat protein
MLHATMLFVSVLSPQTADLSAYRQAIDAYRAGSAVTRSIIVNPSIAARIAEPSSGWTAADLAAAAMLHTDAALRAVNASATKDAAVQLDAAIALLHAAVEREPARAAFARRWRSTVAGLLHAAGARELSATLHGDPMAWLIESERQAAARAAFALGLTAEIRAAVAGPLSGPLPKRNLAVPPDARRSLAEAATHFEHALTSDPAGVEAALHLGRVSLLLGRDVEAERALRTAATAAGAPVRYLAQLFLGTIAERQGRYPDAEREYRAAFAAFPWGQSAPLALSHLLMRDRREADARAAVATRFTTSSTRLVEPLWTYLAEPDTDLGPTLNLLRAEVWR